MQLYLSENPNNSTIKITFESSDIGDEEKTVNLPKQSIEIENRAWDRKTISNQKVIEDVQMWNQQI